MLNLFKGDYKMPPRKKEPMSIENLIKEMVSVEVEKQITEKVNSDKNELKDHINAIISEEVKKHIVEACECLIKKIKS
jgi:hypothetical protein